MYLRTDIWIINRFISPEAAGQYAAILVVANFIRQLGNLGNQQLGPVVMNYWANNEIKQLQRIFRLSIKGFSCALAIPIGLLCIHAENILTLWLGEGFSGFSGLFWVLTLHLSVNTAIYPLFHLTTASNRVKVPALVTFFMGILNVVMSYLLGVTYGMGAMGVALATAVVLTFNSTFFTTAYSAWILKLPTWSLLRPVFSGIPVLCVVFLLAKVPFSMAFGFDSSSVASLILESAIAGLATLVFIWFVVASGNERQLGSDMIRKVVRGVFSPGRAS